MPNVITKTTQTEVHLTANEVATLGPLYNMYARSNGLPINEEWVGGYSYFDEGVIAGEGIWSIAFVQEMPFPTRTGRGVLSSILKKGIMVSLGEYEESGYWLDLTEHGLEVIVAMGDLI